MGFLFCVAPENRFKLDFYSMTKKGFGNEKTPIVKNTPKNMYKTKFPELFGHKTIHPFCFH